MTRDSLSAAFVLAATLAAPTRGDEVTFRLVSDEAGRPTQVRLTVRDLEDGRVAVVRASRRLLVGVGRRTADGFEVDLQDPNPPAAGLVDLGEPWRRPAPPARATYVVADGRISGLIDRAPPTRERGAAEAVRPAVYALGPVGVATDRGAPVDLGRENAAVSRRLRARTPAERDLPWPVIVCPGAASDDPTRPLSPTGRARVHAAARALRETGALAILVTGGNVRPRGTRYNEAMEMKRELRRLGLREEQVAVDPFARHSTTNLRNAGRFLLAHGLDRALIVTSRGQSFYFGHPWLSTFHLRCLWTLGHRVGRLRALDAQRTAFWPSPRCADRGRDALDP